MGSASRRFIVEDEVCRDRSERVAGGYAAARGNSKLERLVADLSLDRHVLQEIVAKKAVRPGRVASWRSGLSRSTGSVSGVLRG